MKQQIVDVINIKITVESACGGVVDGSILYLPTSSKLPHPALNSVLQCLHYLEVQFCRSVLKNQQL